MSVDEAMPTELWMLWRVATEDYDEGWVCAIDGVSGMEGYLAFLSKEIAMGAASDHHVRHGIDCYPVRVYPSTQPCPKQQEII